MGRGMLVFWMLSALFASRAVTLNDSKNTTESEGCSNAAQRIKKLLHPDVYDKAMRPCENGEPVVVKVGLYIVSITSIKESDMEFDIQIYFRQTWRDPRLAFKGLNYTKEKYIAISPGFVWDNIWLPDPYFENEKHGKFHTIMKKNQFLRLYENGNVYYSTRLTLTLSCEMKFYDFPLDSQKCSIVILSYGHSTKDIIYQWMTDKANTSVYKNEFSIPQFELDEIETISHVASYTVGKFNVLTVNLYFHRRVEFYLIHNYIPAILVVIISWLSFWVDRDCAPARVGMGITTILTMTTLLIGVGQQQLPVVSYVKALDWYYIGCFVFVFVGLCEYSIVNYFSTKQSRYLKEQRLKASVNIEKANDEIQPSSFINESYGFDFGSTDSVFHSSQSTFMDEEQKAKQEKKKNEAISEFQVSDAIEKCVRVLYPVLFLIFNIAYWVTYTGQNQ